VTAARLAALRPPRSAADGQAVRAYRAVVEEDAAAPAAVEWHGAGAFTVRASRSAGQAIAVQETWDPAWRAYAGGREIPVERDALGWMRIDAPPGDGEIRLEFAAPFENYAGRAVTGLSLIVLLALVAARPPRRSAAAK
jgi:uncharacterized membrane protein YfhO